MHAKTVVTAAVCVALLWLPAFEAPAGRAAQADVSDADLVQAGRGRLVRVGTPGRVGDATTIPLEVYVAQVLAGEGEPGAADAARQALAIAIRTYATFNAGRHQHEGFDLCNTTHCQVLRASTAATRRAVLATAGLVLTYEGAPAEVFYSASCGGRSERVSDAWPNARPLPYLRSVEDDVHQDDVPWTLERTLDEVRDALVRAGARGRRLEDVTIASRTESGRVGRVSLPGLTPDGMGGDQFRLALGAAELRSTAFTMTREGNRLHFEGRGYGHGVGMCVIGAGRRAARGETAREILARYYPGLSIASVSAPAGPDVLSGPAPPGAAAPPVRIPARATLPVALAQITARVPPGSRVGARDLERIAARAHERLSARLGASVAPLSLTLHDSLESFRAASGRPWWVSAAASGVSIDLAPLAMLDQREGLERTVEGAVAGVIVAGTLADRPAWVRVGAARFFTGGERPAEDERARCPSDVELTAAVSAAAQREADARAEACFARAFARTGDWRSVR